MTTLKDLIINLIGVDNTTIDATSGTLIPDYAFILSCILVIVFTFVVIKGVFALCKR